MSDRSFLVVAVAAIGGAILGAYLFARRGEATVRIASFAPALASLSPTTPTNPNATGGLVNIPPSVQVCGHNPRCLCDQFDVCD